MGTRGTWWRKTGANAAQAKAKANPIAPIPVSHLLLDSLPAHWLPILCPLVLESTWTSSPFLSGLEPFRLSARVGQDGTRMLLSSPLRLLPTPPLPSVST